MARGNLLGLAGTRLVVALTGLVVNVALARGLPRDDFATYRWVWACCAVAAFGGNLGLWQLVTRRVAQAPETAAAVLPTALRGALLTSALTTVGIVAYVGWRDPRPEVVAAAALGALTLAANALAQLVQSGFHGLRRMFVEWSPVLAGRLVFTGSHLVLLGLGLGLVPLYVGRVAGAVVTLVGLLVLWRRSVGPPVAPAPGAVAAWLAEGRWFGPAVLAGAIAAQADVLLLEGLATADEVARYAAPASVLLQLAFVATVLSRGFFPEVSRLAHHAPGEVGGALALQLRMQLLVAAPIAAGGVAVALPLTVRLFGEAYADSAAPLAWLVCAVPFRFVNNALGLTLTALDRQAVRTRVDAVAAVTNVALNLVAIPVWGALGAAVATLATDVVAFVALRAAVGGRVPGEARAWLGTVAPAAAMGLVVAALSTWPVEARVALGAVCYAVLAFAAGGLRRGDLGRLMRV